MILGVFKGKVPGAGSNFEINMWVDIENFFWNNLSWKRELIILKRAHAHTYSKNKRIGKTLQILLLVHEGYFKNNQLILSDQTRAERATLRALKKMGHQVDVFGISIELHPLIEKLNQFNPDLVFPFLEEFHCSADLDFAPIALLESLKIPFVGSGSRGLILSRHKSLAKRRVDFLGVQTPKAWNSEINQNIQFPVIVKSSSEDASLDLHQNCVCYNEKELKKALKRVKKSHMPNPMVEEFIPGREIYISLVEGWQKKVMTPWELRLPNASAIASNKVKWDRKYRFKNKITSGPMKDLSPKILNKIEKQSWKIFKALGLKGYGRIDFRLDLNGHLFFLEANANPNLDPTEDFVRSARSSGLAFDRLIKLLVTEALANNLKK